MGILGNHDSNDVKELKLKVAEARQDDIYRGIVRIDSESMRKLGVKPGDVVEIEGRRKTVAAVDSAYPEDVGLGVIRMDGILRRNAGTSIGSYVTVRKANIKEAQKVILAPAQKGITLRVPPHSLQRMLLGRALIKGDLVVVTPSVQRRRRRYDPFFDEFFSVVEEFFAFGYGPELKLTVVNTVPKGPVIITEATEIELLPKAVEIREDIPDITYEDIGDMEEVVRKVRELVELPLRHPEIFERLGIEPPKGILLYGPPGTGKTLLAKAVANEAGAHFIAINGPEIVSKYVGESEKRLREIFEEARKNSPSIIFIDEIDAIAPKRDEVVGEVERRLVAQLLTLMDGLKERGGVIVIAATNRPNAVDPALRRPGRFDREIEVPVPNEEARYEILKVHTRRVPLGKKIIEEENGKKMEKFVLLGLDERDKLLRKIAELTHGYVGADLAALVKEAAMNAIRRIIPEIEKLGNQNIPPEILEKLVVTEEDLTEALKVVSPSAMREVLVEVPKVKWEDVGGLEEVKQELREAVEWPLKYKSAFKKLGIEPPKGILLYGPPGTGKTLLAKAVATESGSNFIAIKGPEVLSKWFGESEKIIREIFRKARQVSPTVIFFDEIDSIAPRRGSSIDSGALDRVVNQLLTELDGITTRGGVIAIAATNRPDILDPALLRPGRFDRIIYVPPPDEIARLDIFRIHTKDTPLDVNSIIEAISDEDLEKMKDIPDYMLEKFDITKEDLNKYLDSINSLKDAPKNVLRYIMLRKLSKMTELYSGADIEALVREASMLALREVVDKLKQKGLSELEISKEIEKIDIKVHMRHFEEALKKVKPSITKEMIEFYKTFEETYKKSLKEKDIKNRYYG